MRLLISFIFCFSSRKYLPIYVYAAAAANSLQSCLILCDPIDSSPPGSCLWDSPGKNTGVGCHFPLQCMKVKSESEVTQSCPTLRDPMDCSLLGASVHGTSQARVLEWGAIAFSIYVCQSVSQFSRSVMSDSLRPHESQHARPPCPSPTPGVHSDSRPSSQ